MSHLRTSPADGCERGGCQGRVGVTHLRVSSRTRRALAGARGLRWQAGAMNARRQASLSAHTMDKLDLGSSLGSCTLAPHPIFLPNTKRHQMAYLRARNRRRTRACAGNIVCSPPLLPAPVGADSWDAGSQAVHRAMWLS